MSSTDNGAGKPRAPAAIGIASLTYPKGVRPEDVAPAGPEEPGAAPRERRSDDESAGSAQQWPVQFTGSGSEYFRIWIVNLLLTLVTLTLYYPWAKVRKLRYFYGNTQVGDHAFDFHGDPKRMLRGYLLVGALLGVYSLAGNVSPTAGLIALLIIAPLWPLLFRASMRFRLSQTSWRGLRFGFGGDVKGAYLALLPAFIPGLLMLLALSLVDGEPAAAAGAARKAAFGAAEITVLVIMFGSMLLLPWMWYAIKRYQHDHYRFAGDGTRLRAGVGSFYGVFVKAALLAIGIGLAGGLVVALLIGTGLVGAFKGRGGTGAIMVAVVLGVFAIYALLIAIIQPYFASRLQNLLWTRTQARTLRFESQLGFGPLLRLTLKNWLLMLLTLGLYWPFAAVAMARLKLQAVTVTTAPGFERLLAARAHGDKDATGDLAADLFGIDVGL